MVILKMVMNLLLLVFLVSLPSTTATTYYVLADGGDDCPTGNECHPLSYYTSHSDSYFTNNTVFYFLKGNHYMNEGVVIQGKSNITINGNGMSSSVIRCTNKHYGGFVVVGCNSITFSNLSIMECDMSTNLNTTACTFQLNSTISIYSTWAIYLHSVFIEYNGLDQPAALTIANGMELYISDSFFSSRNGFAVEICYRPVTNKNVISESVNVSLINCTMTGGNIGFLLSMLHGMSYRVDMILDDIKVNFNDYNMYLLISNSLYTINMNRIINHNSSVGLLIDSQTVIDRANSTTTPLSYPLTITNSEFYNNSGGLLFTPNNLVVSNKQTILVNSSKIYNSGNCGICISIGSPLGQISYSFEDTIAFNNQNNEINDYNKVTFNNVSIYGTTSTGLTLTGSNTYLYIDGTVKVFNNTGTDGGGIVLSKGSRLLLYLGSQLLVYNNEADNRGGGIFADLAFSCPLVIDCGSGNTGNNPIVNISGNTALLGDDIYGFNAQSCTSNILFNSNIQQTSFGVTACFCNGPLYTDCMISSPQLSSFPGQFISFNIALFGYDYNGNFTITDGSIEIVEGETKNIHSINSSCSSVSQQIRADGNIYIFIVSPNISSLSMRVSILSCPKGFALSSNGICDCSPNIEGSNVICDIETYTISRSGLLWIGTYNISNTNTNAYDTECLIREQCLLCNQSDVTFTLDDNEYLQCDYNRSGMLCGQCRDNYSLLLGSNECSICGNSNLALIILFAALGIILVVFLLLLNLTVAQGTLNGIIFYANIVQLYQPVFSRKGAYPFFSQILSWFNLDFGIEICFFDGMDSYIKTWLQYSFPLYLWIIIIVIILISKRSSRVARLNPVPVLSTLFLLSYTKIVRTVVIGFNLRQILFHCHGNNTALVKLFWDIDPNLPYAQGKHAWLFAFSIIALLFFCIPYTLFLLFNPLLERYCQNYKCCHFLFKLKPIFDAYNGRVKDKYRFWTGLLLVARLPPLLAVAFVNSNDNESRSILLTVLITSTALLLSLSLWLEGVYEIRFLNILESWFLINIILMSSLAISIDPDTETSRVFITISIAIFIGSFVVILVYHVRLKLSHNAWFRTSIQKLKFKKKKNHTLDKATDVAVITHQSINLSNFVKRCDSTLELFDPPNDDDYEQIED